MDGTFDVMAQALKASGLAAALRVLNDRIQHRYSAVYQLQGRDRLVIWRWSTSATNPARPT
ncbi:hypothetical protein ACSFA2_04035 [Variovorax sp. LT2P21]|uniref:hypothetical protein n=1 Tax=Variovorax sp. LT2P21 TaxID=3443731 RepID=UPI003F448D32